MTGMSVINCDNYHKSFPTQKKIDLYVGLRVCNLGLSCLTIHRIVGIYEKNLLYSKVCLLSFLTISTRIRIWVYIDAHYLVYSIKLVKTETDECTKKVNHSPNDYFFVNAGNLKDMRVSGAKCMTVSKQLTIRILHNKRWSSLSCLINKKEVMMFQEHQPLHGRILHSTLSLSVAAILCISGLR